ncbi:MAG: hypothetical protein JSU77_04460 [Fidelibacterota bacterium]|nr:MAG: hypothetical protein JSU77_04460 [Candidatus Neomarinimicrobiota bacterium]
MIKEIVIIGKIITLLTSGTLTEQDLVQYFNANKAILNSNIEQAVYSYKKDTLGELVSENYSRYLEDKALILSNYERYSEAKEKAIESMNRAYGSNIPEVLIVPCIGLYANAGWAQDVDDKHYVCLALERLPENRNIEILLAHEIGHAISEIDWSTVLDGFYNEGHATYVSSVLVPGYSDEEYLHMSREMYNSCLDWIDANRDKIAADAGEKLEVMNEYHKFYLTTRYNVNHENIGYLIGYEYLKYLNKKYSLRELLAFDLNAAANRREFQEFISSWVRP